jgi:hypothetical protein
MTVLEIVNRVLRRLREDTVTSLIETDYSRMVAEMLYDVHQECLEYDWSAMQHVIDVPVDASQRVLDLTRLEANSGDILAGGRVTKNDSYVMWDRNHLPMAWIFDDTSDTEGDRMIYLQQADMEHLYQTDRDFTADDATYFSLRMSPDRDGLSMTVWPPPDAAKHIRMRMWTPEDEIDVTADDDTTLLVPSRPLILGTIMLALNERGEELGEPGNVAERRYYEARSAAIELDMKRKEHADEFEAVRE